MTAPALAVWDPRRIELDHHVSLEAYSRGLKQKVDEVVRGAFAEVNSTLLTKYSDLTPFQKQRAMELYARTGQILQTGYRDVSKLVDGEMFNLAAVEGEFAQDLLQARLAYAGIGLEANTTRLTQAQLGAIASYPVQGHELGDWWKQSGQQAAFKVKQQVQQGLLAGEGIDKIVRRVGIAEGATRRGTQMLVRTAVTSVSTEAQFQGLQDAGSEVSDEYEIVATLDDRTSEICASLDGQRFRWDDPKGQRPPFHLNCRTTIVAVVNWKALGVADPTRGMDITRASQGGPLVSRGTPIDYAGWLKQQPVSVQDDILGVAKGKLFRSGRATLADLVKQDGTAINLTQLQRRLGLRSDEMPTSIRSPASRRGPLTPGLDLADVESAAAVDAAQAAALNVDYAAMTDEQVLEWALARPGFYLTRAGQIEKTVPGFKARVQKAVRDFRAGGGVLPPKPPPKIRPGGGGGAGGPLPPVPPEPPAPPPIVEPPVTLPKLRTAEDYRALTDKQVQLWASERQSFYLTRAAQIDKKLGTEFKARARDVVKRMGFVEVQQPPGAFGVDVLPPKVAKGFSPFRPAADSFAMPEGIDSRLVAELRRDRFAIRPDLAPFHINNAAARLGIEPPSRDVWRRFARDYEAKWTAHLEKYRKQILALPAAPIPQTLKEAQILGENLGVQRFEATKDSQLWQTQESTKVLWQMAKHGYEMPPTWMMHSGEFSGYRSAYGIYSSAEQRIAINPIKPGYGRGKGAPWTQQEWIDSHANSAGGWHPVGGANAMGSTQVHEMGHFLHNQNVGAALEAMGKPGYERSGWWAKGHNGWRGGLDYGLGAYQPTALDRMTFGGGVTPDWERAYKIAGKVSRYAQENPLEFIAETFTGLSYGKTYDQDVMDLYRALHGPEVKGRILS